MKRLTDSELLALIGTVNQELLTMALTPPLESILRQLDWGRRKISGDEVDPIPGPFTMGVISIRELGGCDDLISRICEIQSELKARVPAVTLSDMEKRKRKRKQAFKEFGTQG